MGNTAQDGNIERSTDNHLGPVDYLTKCLRALLNAVDDSETPEDLREPIKHSLAESVIEIEESSDERGWLKLICRAEGCKAGCTLTRLPDKVLASPTENTDEPTRTLGNCVLE